MLARNEKSLDRGMWMWEESREDALPAGQDTEGEHDRTRRRGSV